MRALGLPFLLLSAFILCVLDAHAQATAWDLEVQSGSRFTKELRGFDFASADSIIWTIKDQPAQSGLPSTTYASFNCADDPARLACSDTSLVFDVPTTQIACPSGHTCWHELSVRQAGASAIDIWLAGTLTVQPFGVPVNPGSASQTLVVTLQPVGTISLTQYSTASLATAIAGASAAGNSKYYGTNAGGVVGFYDLPAGGGGGAAPADAAYLVGAADATLTGEIVVSNLAQLNTHLSSSIADGPHATECATSPCDLDASTTIGGATVLRSNVDAVLSDGVDDSPALTLTPASQPGWKIYATNNGLDAQLYIEGLGTVVFDEVVLWNALSRNVNLRIPQGDITLEGGALTVQEFITVQGDGGGTGLALTNGADIDFTTSGGSFKLDPPASATNGYTCIFEDDASFIPDSCVGDGVDSDTQLSQEQVEDFAGAMVSGNTETLITVTYQDSDGTVDFAVTPTLSSYTNDAGFLTSAAPVGAQYLVGAADATLTNETVIATLANLNTHLGTTIADGPHVTDYVSAASGGTFSGNVNLDARLTFFSNIDKGVYTTGASNNTLVLSNFEDLSFRVWNGASYAEQVRIEDDSLIVAGGADIGGTLVAGAGTFDGDIIIDNNNKLILEEAAGSGNDSIKLDTDATLSGSLTLRLGNSMVTGCQTPGNVLEVASYSAGVATLECDTDDSSGGGAINIQEGDVTVTASATDLDFGAGFDVTDSPAGEANVVLDYTEDPVDLGTAEITGTLAVSNGGTGAVSYTSGAPLFGNGTGAILPGSVLQNGELLIGDGVSFPTTATLTGGTNLTVTNGAGSITLDVDDAFVANTGDAIAGDLDFNDGTTDSPKATFTPATGTAWDIYAEDTGDDLQIEVSTASTETLDIVNTGAGVVDVNIDGALTVTGAASASNLSGTNTGDETLSTSSLGLDVADHVVDLDVTPATGFATLEQTNDAVSVKFGASFTANGSGLQIAANGVDASHIATDAVQLDELDDDANTPVAGYALIVEAGANTVDYLDLAATYQGLDADLTDLADGILTGSKVAAATTTVRGAVELATTAEVTAGTDPAAVVTPQTLEDGFDGNLFIATTGTITTGVWNGTVIADAYVADDLTISSSGDVDGDAVNQQEMEVQVNAQTGTTYTLVLTDQSKLVTMDNASANTVTIPTNASVAFPVGSVVCFLQLGAGATTISGDTGVTVNGTSAGSEAITAQWGQACATKYATDSWAIEGRI